MFLAHFGVGFGTKAVAPRISLGWLLLAAQFIDLLWPTLLLLGVERVRIEPGATAVTPLVFEHYPVSHSLLMVLFWGIALGLVHFVLNRDRRSAVIIALLVVSHWFLDLLVHIPDLPLYPGGVRVGLGLWSSLPFTLILELTFFVVGAGLYARATRPLDQSGHWGFVALVIFLLLSYLGNLLGAPPSVRALAWVGQMQWLLVVWGFWLDQRRYVMPLAFNTPWFRR